MLCYEISDFEWSRVGVKQPIEGFAHAACTQIGYQPYQVVNTSSLDTIKTQRPPSSESDGFYFFGGLNAKGELLDKLL